jgi:hypothetical protein
MRLIIYSNVPLLMQDNRFDLNNCVNIDKQRDVVNIMGWHLNADRRTKLETNIQHCLQVLNDIMCMRTEELRYMWLPYDDKVLLRAKMTEESTKTEGIER